MTRSAMADAPDHLRPFSTESQPRSAEDPSSRVIELVREALRSIRFGQVVLTVHDGVVVQLDRLEKTRLR